MELRKQNGGGLEYEQFPGQVDIKVSKIQTTPEDDKIRAIVTTGNSLVFAGVGRENGDTLIVNGDPAPDLVVYGRIWDAIKRVGKAIGGLFHSSGQKCTTTTVITHGKDGSTTVTVSMTCSPA